MQENKKIKYGLRPVKGKDILGAGLTLSLGHLTLPLIPFKKAKEFRAFPDKKRMKGGTKK